MFEYRAATAEDLEKIWQKDVAQNAGDERWPRWKAEYVENNRTGQCKTFVVLREGEPVGQGTLLFSPACSAVLGQRELADEGNIANVNALRITKEWEGGGHISKLMRLMEQWAANAGYRQLTIGVEARESRNLAIYLHWGYDRFVKGQVEDGVLLLYYAKRLA
ncbi:MAG: GNAT family N-acetyltransferase [Eubacteriales bacterium]|nr:GNAT family N-acetyltransferase [Eubacteriales bacterium]